MSLVFVSGCQAIGEERRSSLEKLIEAVLDQIHEQSGGKDAAPKEADHAADYFARTICHDDLALCSSFRRGEIEYSQCIIKGGI